MKVVLSTLNSKYIHSSLALAYLEEACRCDDWEIEVLEFTINDDISNIMASLFERSPDILCFSVYIWNVKEIMALCCDYKKVAPNTTIILGGPEVSYHAEQVLLENPAIDYIVRGEGEITLRELLGQLYGRGNFDSVKGISYRINGQVKENPAREVISDLNCLPSPFLRDFSAYKERIVYYESSRGCPFNCSYCLSSTNKGVRYLPLDRVKRELKHLLSFPLRELKFVDRTFNCYEKRACEIMQFIVDQHAQTKVHLEICADIITDRFLDFLRQIPAGIFNFEIGVQSTYPPALQAVNRASNWEHLQKNIKTLKAFNNIHLHLDLIAGLPEESYIHFQQSFNDVYRLQPDMLQLGFLKLLKGSEIYEKREKYGYRFQSQPPYQVLSNRYLSYSDMIKLSQVEQLLNRYYNKKIVPLTLKYVTEYLYKGNAFAFFKDFACFWHENKLFNLGHSREREYDILLDFLNFRYPDKKEENNELIKYDFLSNNLPHRFPQKVERYALSEARELLSSCLENKKIIQMLPEYIKGSKREMMKRLQIEYFTINPITLEQTPSLLALLFAYHPLKKGAVTVLTIT